MAAAPPDRSEGLSRPAQIVVGWRSRATPLSPCGVVGVEAVAVALAARVAHASAARRQSWSALVTAKEPRAFILLGDASTLPWVDGVVYIGRDTAAPGLLLPTSAELGAHPQLVLDGLCAEHGVRAPCLLLRQPSLLVPLEGARAIHRPTLDAWIAENGRAV